MVHNVPDIKAFSFVCMHVCEAYIVIYIGIQWNPSKADTNGTVTFVLYREVSLTQGFFQKDVYITEKNQ